MKKIERVVLTGAALAVAVVPMLSQTPPAQQAAKPAFEVVSIKPSAPGPGMRGGGARGNRYTMAGATLRMLLQTAYQQSATGGPSTRLEIVGAPGWLESDLYNIEATIDCSAGPVPREHLAPMVQSMLEDRFQLKAHMETRELPIYHLVVAKDGPKIKASEDQTPPFARPGGPPPFCAPAPGAVNTPPPAPPPPIPGQRGGPFDPNFRLPRGSMMMAMSPNGLVIQGTAVALTSLVNSLQQQVGRAVIDKTDLKGLFFRLEFSREGLSLPAPPPGFAPPPGVPPGATPAPPVASDPFPSLFTAIQELGLKLESAKGPVPVLVIDSVQKPTMN